MNATPLWLQIAAVCYLLAGFLALQELLQRRLLGRWIGLSTLVGSFFVGVSIAARWQNFGQGPFITLYEVLLSSLWSLGLVYGLAYWFNPKLRAGAPLALGIILLLFLWAATVDSGYTPLPPTYATPWLWAHVLSGKLFLGCCLVALSLALPLLLPQAWSRLPLLLHGTDAHTLELLSWRWLALAFVFHSAMLIAGAVWAQDAWGRYWDWDPLETWAFATWLCMAGGLHARSAMGIGPRLGSTIILASFVLAFLTFFGVPFVSLNPHQGAV